MIASRASQHNFSKGPDANIARSVFDRSFEVKDTMDFDKLIPIFNDEILPGDDVSLTIDAFIRLSSFALKVPVMEQMTVDVHAFFVPNRLTWDNWERFMGAQDNPDSSTDYIMPTITSRASTGEAVGSMWDKMGLPTGIPGLEVISLPFRAAALIYNYWYRDQNLQDSLDVPTDNGPDLPTEDFCQIQTRNKAHNYFTAALPFAQKGPAVEIPFSNVPVVGINGVAPELLRTGQPVRNLQVNNDAQNSVSLTGAGMYGTGTLYWGSNTGLIAQTETVSPTVNTIRQAFGVQSLYELDARGGTRYPELVFAHFKVVVPDFRVQFPEYLGGGQITIGSNPVAQTSPTSGNNAQGQLAAFGTGLKRGINITKSFVEHGCLLIFASARANQTFQQGINKRWLRSTKLDFFWGKLQELGEQTVLSKEIYADGSVDDDDVFGYQERYAEYRYMPSEIRGEFRSTYATSLDQWHLAEEFGSRPELNDTFIKSSTPIERVLAVNTGSDLLCQWVFRYRHARPMLTYSNPSNLGRF